jgi:hypothetical protein
VLAILAVVVSAGLAGVAVVGEAMLELSAMVASALPEVSAVVVLAVLVMLEVVTVSAAVVSAGLAEELVALTVPAAMAGWAEARLAYEESIALEEEPAVYQLI